jgi:pyrimidine operon attenuation protein/uracil phosphoribosyltransferase
MEVPTHQNEEVRVKVKELDGEDAVYLVNVEQEEGNE